MRHPIRAAEDNPYDDPQDPRYIPHYVWDQLDMEGRLWVATRQDINAMDVYHLQRALNGLSGTVGRLWLALFACGFITVLSLVLLAYVRLR